MATVATVAFEAGDGHAVDRERACPAHVLGVGPEHGDLDLARSLLPNAEAALAWMRDYGDPEGDGFLKFHSRSSEGIRNLPEYEGDEPGGARERELARRGDIRADSFLAQQPEQLPGVAAADRIAQSLCAPALRKAA